MVGVSVSHSKCFEGWFNWAHIYCSYEQGSYLFYLFLFYFLFLFLFIYLFFGWVGGWGCISFFFFFFFLCVCVCGRGGCDGICIYLLISTIALLSKVSSMWVGGARHYSCIDYAWSVGHCLQTWRIVSCTCCLLGALNSYGSLLDALHVSSGISQLCLL